MQNEDRDCARFVAVGELSARAAHGAAPLLTDVFSFVAASPEIATAADLLSKLDASIDNGLPLKGLGAARLDLMMARSSLAA